MNNDISKHIQNTLLILEEVPEPYKLKAFEIILNHLLDHETKFEEELGQRISAPKKHEGIDEILKSRFDWGTLPIMSLKPTPQLLLILKIAKENFNMDELSAVDVRTILIEKFRIQKSTSAISMLLMEKLGKYVDRVQEGNRFHYRITKNGMSFVDSELKEVRNYEHR